MQQKGIISKSWFGAFIKNSVQKEKTAYKHRPMWIQASKTPDRVEDKCSYTEDVLLAQRGVVWNAFLCTYLILILFSKHCIPSWFDFTAQKLLMIVLKWMGARFEDWLNTCMDQEDSLGFEWPSSFYIQKKTLCYYEIKRCICIISYCHYLTQICSKLIRCESVTCSCRKKKDQEKKKQQELFKIKK